MHVETTNKETDTKKAGQLSFLKYNCSFFVMFDPIWKLHLTVTLKAKTKSKHKLLHWVSPCCEVQENPAQKNSCNILVRGFLGEYSDIKPLSPLQRSKNSSYVVSRLAVSVEIRN